MHGFLDNLFLWFSNWFTPKPTPVPEPEPVPPPRPNPCPIPPSPESQVVAAINSARELNGMPALREDGPLDRLSRSWASTMSSSGGLSHGDFAGRIASVYPNLAAAENIAKGQPDAASVVAAWMNDPPHRANILGEFNLVGVGLDRNASGSIFWCADFVQQ